MSSWLLQYMNPHEVPAAQADQTRVRSKLPPLGPTRTVGPATGRPGYTTASKVFDIVEGKTSGSAVSTLLNPLHAAAAAGAATARALDRARAGGSKTEPLKELGLAAAGFVLPETKLGKKIIAAIRVGGRTFTGPSHLAAVENALEQGISRAELSAAEDGFRVGDQFLSREATANLLKKEGTIPSGFPSKYLTSEETNGLGRGAVGDSLVARGAKALSRANPEALRVLEGLLDPAGVQLSRDITAIDADKAARMAKVYESLPKHDPAAKDAYDALNREVEKQFKAIQDAGFKIEFTDADPYKNSAEMMADVRDNRRLKVFKTPSDNFHPYLTPEQNDRFRAVHDFLAHAAEGHQFGALGEEKAYRVHASTLPPLARRALATETRGQNSWVNYGPNAHLPVRERPFAEQKAALWPEELTGDYPDMRFPEAVGDSLVARGAKNAIKPLGLTGPITDPTTSGTALSKLDDIFSQMKAGFLPAIEAAKIRGALADKTAIELRYNPKTQHLEVFDRADGPRFYLQLQNEGKYTPDELRQVLGEETANKLLASTPTTHEIGRRGDEVWHSEPLQRLKGRFTFSPMRVRGGRPVIADWNIDPAILDQIAPVSVVEPPPPPAKGLPRAVGDSLVARGAKALGGAPQLPPNYGLLTPENPKGNRLPVRVNDARRAAFEKELKHRGIKFERVKGRYPTDAGDVLDEKSYLIHDQDPTVIADLGQRYGQKSVIVPEGMHNLSQGMLSPTTGVRAVGPDAPHGFTELPNGQRFSLDFNWDNPVPRPAPVGRDQDLLTNLTAPSQSSIIRPLGPRIPEQRIEEVYDRASKAMNSKKWLEMLTSGAAQGGHLWYLNHIGQRAIDALGEHEGPLAFRELMDLMSASTARSEPVGNLKRASLWRAGLHRGAFTPDELRGKALPVPPGFGHFAQKTHQQAIANWMDNNRVIDPMANPKPAGFSENLRGNELPATVDDVMSRILSERDPRLKDLAFTVSVDPKTGRETGYAPRPWAYAPIERAMQDAAAKHAGMGLFDVPPGYAPTGLEQAAVWVGSKAPTEAPGIDRIFNKLLGESAQLWATPNLTRANELFWRNANPFLLPLDLPVFGRR